jgi:rod shape-determining protein MreC
MENFFSRYKNPLVLMAVLFIQVIALATQVKRPENTKASGSGGTRLIRVWTVTAITPFERALVATGHFFRNTWHNYIDLHNVRKQNRELQEELARMRLEQVRLRASAEQTRGLQALLEFKERYVGQTVAAQVIGSSGSDLSHMISIDKGSSDGIKPDMAVITPDGIVGKVKDVFPLSSQVLMITDRDSGAGVILESSRLQGDLKGTGQSDLQVKYIMSDEKVDVGEQVVTSGGDRIFPKGLPVGTVTSVGSDNEGTPFLAIKVKPAANLNRLEEVLVVTKIAEEAPGPAGPRRAAEILAQRLPSVAKPDDAGKAAAGNTPGAGNQNPSGIQSAVPTPGITTPKKIAPGGTAGSGTPADAGTNGAATSGTAASQKTTSEKMGETTAGENSAAGTVPTATGSPSPKPKPKTTAPPAQATPSETPRSKAPQTKEQKPSSGDVEKPPQ